RGNYAKTAAASRTPAVAARTTSRRVFYCGRRPCASTAGWDSVNVALSAGSSPTAQGDVGETALLIAASARSVKCGTFVAESDNTFSGTGGVPKWKPSSS